MAKISLSPLIVDIRGKQSDTVFSKWRGRNYIRSRVTPANPQSDDQTAVRDSMTYCVAIWQELLAGFKTAWNNAASGLTMSGFNKFMKTNRAAQQAQTDLTMTPITEEQALVSLSVASGAAQGQLALTIAPTTVATGKRLDIVILEFDAIKGQYRVDGTSTKAAGAAASHTVSGLTPSATDYVYACLVDVASTEASACLVDDATVHA